MSLIWVGINNGQKKMFDKYIYNFLMWVNHWSTKLTSWSWCMLYSDRNKGYGNRRRQKNSEDFKKSEQK